MRLRMLVPAAAAVAVLTVPQIASAHATGSLANDFAAGAGHPLSGLDHVLAMGAVGLIAARSGGRAVWTLPAAFVTCMAAGAGLAGAGVGLPAVEQGIAASVLVLGVLVAIAARVPLAAGTTLVGLFAVFHGHAHGTEMAGANASGYVAGFVAATIALHAAGVGLGLAGRAITYADDAAAAAFRLVGGGIAACGAALWIGAP